MGSRREFLAALGALATSTVTACGNGQRTSADRSTGDHHRLIQQTGPVREFWLEAAPGEVEVGAGRKYQSWFYNGQFPGPEIRVKEGERLRITLVNRLPEGTTIHWHGVPVPNAMDGVPGLTQQPVASGESFVYDFVAGPAGTYMYHSHVGLQLDRGLIAPLVVEEPSQHVQYDREYSLVLDDFLSGVPRPLSETAETGRGMRPGQRGGGMGGMMGRMRGGMMMAQVPPYDGLLINGRLPQDPAVFETKSGQRLRLRLHNPSGATTFRFAIAGHRMSITHTDGRPVEPVEVDALDIAMGERYDVVVDCRSPGLWQIAAATLEGNSAPARALLRYTDASRSQPPANVLPEGIRGGRLLDLAWLRSLELEDGSRNPDRTYDFTLSGGMMGSAWTIDGQAYPNADPVEIREGEHVRVSMVNHSMMIHPMHLHGHFFRVENVLKDTVLVSPHMGRASFEFRADNPGRWLFHCHNVYHLEAGMAREFRYVR